MSKKMTGAVLAAAGMTMTDAVNVLVIDDSVDDRLLYRRVLTKAFGDRLRFTEETSGETGLGAIAEPTGHGRNGVLVVRIDDRSLRRKPVHRRT